MPIPTLSKSHLARGALLLILGLPTTVHSLTSYANDFVDPNYIVGKKFPAHTAIAQKTIVQWANQYAVLGPWSMWFDLLISSHDLVEGPRSILTSGSSRCHEQDHRSTHRRQTHVHELVAVLVAGLFWCGKHDRVARKGRFERLIDFGHSSSSDVTRSLHEMQVCAARRPLQPGC